MQGTMYKQVLCSKYQ